MGDHLWFWKTHSNITPRYRINFPNSKVLCVPIGFEVGGIPAASILYFEVVGPPFLMRLVLQVVYIFWPFLVGTSWEYIKNWSSDHLIVYSSCFVLSLVYLWIHIVILILIVLLMYMIYVLVWKLLIMTKEISGMVGQ